MLFDQVRELKQEELKNKLAILLENENQQFSVQAEHFFQSEKRTHVDYLQLCESILSTIENVLKTQGWESSLYLHNLIKPLLKIQEETLQLKNLLTEQVQKTQTKKTLQQGQQKLFIALYQADGLNMQKWAEQLHALPRHLTGRPIYHNEEHVQQLLRSKLHQPTEAYIVVAVNEKYILNISKERTDKFGNALANVMEGKISGEDILEFVHLGKRYYVEEQKLFPI